MKSKMKYLFLILSIFSLIMLVSCKNNENNQETKIEINCVNAILLGEETDISVSLNKPGLSYTITVEDESIIDISDDIITGLKVGNTNIKITVNDGTVKEFNFSVTEPTFDVVFDDFGEIVYEDGKTYQLSYDVISNSTSLSNAGVILKSSDETIAKINNKGVLTVLKPGNVDIVATSKFNENYLKVLRIEVKFDPIAIVASWNIDKAMYQNVTTYGNTQINQMVMGSVNLYANMDLNLVERIIPISKDGKYQGLTATPELLTSAENEKYTRSGILHTETSKITYHDTGNNTKGADANSHANYMVSDSNYNSRARSWHYTVDSNRVIQHIPDDEVTWQGDSYEAYSTSIGIETCVDSGSDLELTWHRTAKLMASLLVKHDLEVSDIVQHYDWSKKNCPQTLRMNNLYPYAIDMVEAEYTALTVLDGYKISFKSLYPEYVDDRGKMIKLPDYDTEICYIVNVTNGKDYDQSIALYSIIPGQYNTKKITISDELKAFYKVLAESGEDTLKVANAYENLSQENKANALGLDILKDRSLKLYGEENKASVSIEEVNVSNIYKYNYVLFKNNLDSNIDLHSYVIKADDKELILPNKTIKAGCYILLAFNEVEEPIDERFLMPDIAWDIDLTECKSISIFKDGVILDKVSFDKTLIRVAYSGENDKDYLGLCPNPKNSKGALIDNSLSKNTLKAAVAILSLPYEVTLEDGDKINYAYNLYNSLSIKEKNLIRDYSYLNSRKTKYEELASQN